MQRQQNHYVAKGSQQQSSQPLYKPRSKTPTTQRGLSQDRFVVKNSNKQSKPALGNYYVKNVSQTQRQPQPQKKDKISMYSLSGDPSQIDILTEKEKFLKTPDQIHGLVEEFKIIKVHADECKIDPSIIVKDLALTISGPKEDESFSEDPYLWVNFRRGNTILDIYDPNNYEQLVNRVIGRKGLSKFFDIKYDFVSKDGRYRDLDLNYFEEDVKNHILAGAKKAILQGHQVEVVKSLKANGENCQISWNPEADAWVIASKNVALLARDAEDLLKYPPKSIRYSFATMMANCWFELISRLTSKEYQMLKSDMSNRTWVGEYIGNPKCQHLVRYPRETIIFYAIVDNNSRKICRLPEDSLKFFKKYNFDAVQLNSLGVFNNYDKLCDVLSYEYENVASQSIQNEEEGAVLYFVKRDSQDKSNDEILSLSKLKTLEYRLFRKMREKLRNYVSQKSMATPEMIKERFIKESRDLSRGLGLPHPLDFYIDLFLQAFVLISRGSIKEIQYYEDMLMNEYVTFLEEVNNIYEEKYRSNKQRYVGKVNFKSIILDHQDKIQYNGYQGERNRKNSVESQETEVKIQEPKSQVSTKADIQEKSELRQVSNVQPKLSSALKTSGSSKNSQAKPQHIKINEIPQVNLINNDTQNSGPATTVVYKKKEQQIKQFNPSTSPTQSRQVLEVNYKPSIASLIEKKPSPNPLYTNRARTGKKQIAILLPIGIPGMGKTTLIQSILKPFFEITTECKFHTLSNDEIKREQMDLYMKKNPTKTSKDAFDNTHKQTVKIFNETLQAKIKQAVQDDSNDIHIICIDKNHVPPIIQQTLTIIDQSVEEKYRQKVEILKIALVPEQPNPHRGYPFSLSMLVQCFQRCLERANHQTLTNEDPNHLARVLFLFFRKYKGQKFDDQFLKDHALDDFMRVPLTFEHEDLQLPDNLHRNVEQCLENTGDAYPMPHPVFDKFVHLSQIYKSFFKGSSGQEEYMDQHLESNFQRLFKKILSPGLKKKQSGSSKQPPERKISHQMFIDEQLNDFIQNEKKNLNSSNGQTPLRQNEIQSASTTTPQQSSHRVVEEIKYEEVSHQVFKQAETKYPKKKSNGSKPILQNNSNQQTTEVLKGNYKPKQIQENNKMSQSNDDGFQNTVANKKQNRRASYSSEDDVIEKLPIYLGIFFDEDNNAAGKIKKILLESVEQLFNFDKINQIKTLWESINQLYDTKGGKYNGWQLVKDPHVTVLYVGRDQERTESKIYQEFEEDLQESITVYGVVVVPGKIITAICFPQHSVDNRCPHITLCTGEWQAKMSNDVLQESCSNPRGSFNDAYVQLRNNGRVKEGMEILKTESCKVNKKLPSVPCYFVALKSPIVLEGITRKSFN